MNNNEENLKDFIKKTIIENASMNPFSPDYFETKVNQVYEYLENTALRKTNLKDHCINFLNLSAKSYLTVWDGGSLDNPVEIKIQTREAVEESFRQGIMKIYKTIKDSNISKD